MIKFFTTSLFFTCVFCSLSFAQKAFHAEAQFNQTHLKKPSSAFRTDAAGCDTVNLPVDTSWHLRLYYSTTQAGEVNGFITGDNVYGDQEKAAYFDVSSSANTFLTKVWIAFGVANSNTAANLSTVIPIKIYDGTSGVPGTLLTTVNKALSDLKLDVDNSNYSEIVFPAAVSLPASKKFFVSVDVSNLVFSETIQDSLAIFSSLPNKVTQGQNGFGMEKYNDKWYTFKQDWGADFGLYIHPFVSTNATCATTLPVTLTDFHGEHIGSANVLSWTTLTEQNNKGFEIQRSADGNNFSTLGFVQSRASGGQSTSSISYRFADEKPFDGNVYYRLKQMDLDGRSTLSSVVILKSANALLNFSIYPNPVNRELNMVLNAPVTHNVTILVTDLAGKVLMKEAASVIAGSNKILLNVGKLASGSYMIKTICANGCETVVKKFVKR